MRKADWNADRNTRVERSPLLNSAATSRYKVQPAAVAMETKQKPKKKSGWSQMWNGPANQTIVHASASSALAPPTPSTGHQYADREGERRSSIDGGSGRKRYGGVDEETDYVSEASNKSPSLQRTSHAATTELQMLDTRRTWLLLCLPAIFAVAIFLFPPQWSIEINTVGLPFGPNPGRRALLDDRGDSTPMLAVSPLAPRRDPNTDVKTMSSGMVLHIEKSVQAMKYVQISVQLSEGADRTIPLSELKKIKVEIEPYITCIGRGGDDADDMDTERGVQRIVSAISLDTSESFYFDYSNKSALVPSTIPLLYSSFTFGTISAAPLRKSNAQIWNASGVVDIEGGAGDGAPPDDSYYTFDATLSFRHRDDSDPALASAASSVGQEGERRRGYSDRERQLRRVQTKEQEEGHRPTGEAPPTQAQAQAQGAREGVLSRLLAGSYLQVASQSLFFSLFDVVLRFCLCSASLYLYYVWWCRNWASSPALPAEGEGEGEGEGGGENRGCCSARLQRFYAFNTWLATALRAMLPEQITSVWLLFFLLLWQSPMDVLLSTTSLLGPASPPLHIHEAAFHLKYAAKSGFLYCLLVYIAGLKFYPGLAYHYYTQTRGPGLDFDGVIGGEEEPGGEQAAGRASPRKTFGLLGWMQDRQTRAGGTAAGAGASTATGVRRVWVGGRDAVRRLYRGAFSRQSLAAVIGASNGRGGGDIEGLLEADTTADHPSFGLPVHHCLSTEYPDFIWNKILLLFLCWAMQGVCWYYMRKARQDLATHLGSQGRGSDSTHSGEEEQEELAGYLHARYVAWHNILFLCLYGVTILWTVLIFYSGKITNYHLKVINYGLSRHRHLSFRLLLTQIYIWTAVVVTAGLYRYEQCMGILHQSFNFLRDSTMLLMLFSKPPSQASYYSFALWEEKQQQLMTFLSSEYLPPFGFFTYLDLLSLSAVAYTIVYAYLPPQGDEWQAGFDRDKHADADGDGLSSPQHQIRTLSKQAAAGAGAANGRKYSLYSDSYTPLERDMPPVQGQRQGRGRVKHAAEGELASLFCLETACRLLEISEQSYYRPSMLHLEKIGAYPITDTDKRCLAREARDQVARQSSSDTLKSMDKGSTGAGAGAGAGVVMNPFDDGYDEAAAAQALLSSQPEKADTEGNAGGQEDASTDHTDVGELNRLSPYSMNLEPLGAQLLSLFHDGTYQNLGFVARALPAVDAAGGRGGVNRALGGGAVPDSEGTHPRLASLTCRESQSKLYICFRGTTDLTNMMTDLRAFPSAMMQVREDCAYFRNIIITPGAGTGGDISEDGGGGQSHRTPVKEGPEPEPEPEVGRHTSGASADNADGRSAASPSIEDSAEPTMHVGFKEAYFHIRREALSSVVNAMFMLRLTAAKRNREDQKGTRKPNSKGQGQSAIAAPPPLQLVFCGHSLGGVLAALLAYDISLNLEYILRAISLELRIELEADKDEGDNAPEDEEGGGWTPGPCQYQHIHVRRSPGGK